MLQQDICAISACPRTHRSIVFVVAMATSRGEARTVSLRSLRIPYMLSSKVIGRAGRRRGCGRRGHDGRAQLRRRLGDAEAAVERPPASDGAVVAREARILSFAFDTRL